MLYSKSGVQLQNSSNRETDDPFVVAAINPMVGIGYHEHTCKYEKKRSKIPEMEVKRVHYPSSMTVLLSQISLSFLFHAFTVSLFLSKQRRRT